MKQFLLSLLAPVTPETFERVYLFLRVGIGILTIIHGIPKMFGGVETWRQLGTFVLPLGIHFLPVFWGLLGALTEFVGGIALVFGFGTRIASLALILMMIVAFIWHLHRHDVFNVYSLSLTLIIIYSIFLIIGGGKYSLDTYLYNNV